MSKAYIMVGLPGSGKSTWIKNNVPNAEVISRDLIRIELGYCTADEKFAGNSEQEAKVTEIQNKKIDYCCRNGIDFVIDNTNLNKYRLQLVNSIRKKYPDVRIIYVVMNTNINTCTYRRNGQIDSSIIQRMKDGYKEPLPTEYDEIINVGDNTEEEVKKRLNEIVCDTMIKYGNNAFDSLRMPRVIESIIKEEELPNMLTIMKVIGKTDLAKPYLAEERDKFWELYLKII